ncbi:MAG TPA: Nif3-like dinuclear metal center hexameric protein [Puia sp.]|nr:Nif3-like dinuclear metal center hexameric protein [Puia sp.]
MRIAEIIGHLEVLAPPAVQEHYDNAGLLTGHAGWECPGALVALDATEEVVMEAAASGCNLVVAHHPIVFGGLKKITGRNYVEKAVIAAIKNDIAIYAIHTNLDNMVTKGVNGRIADMLGLVARRVLAAKESTLCKLYCFVPIGQLEAVRSAMFAAGAGHIGNYSECSYSVEGMGTFKAGEGTQPFVGAVGRRHEEKEARLEVILPVMLQRQVVAAMVAAHPYEEVAYDLVPLINPHGGIGAGLVGELPSPTEEEAFLDRLTSIFRVPVVRHTRLTGKPVKTVAVCGGAGSSFISNALSSGATFYLTSDVKYHEFFDANDRLVIADIGHFESEQFTIDLLVQVLQEKFSNFAVLKSGVRTNPVHYHLSPGNRII